MTKEWETHLDRWTGAGLLDPDSAGRIRVWEHQRSRGQGLSWTARIVLVFGALLLAAGVLLFVSAHWDNLSRGGRLAVLAMAVALLHGSGAAARRFDGLAVALHTVGSVALGAAIALAGQIYNLNEHWPAAVLLWAIGCALAWLLLQHWTQGALCAVLFPWWLAGEWDTHLPQVNSRAMLPVWVGLCALSFVYLSARRSAADSPLRKALGWLGGLALLPLAAILAAYGVLARAGVAWGSAEDAMAWGLALLVPLGVALAIDRRRAVWNAVAIAWTVMLGLIGMGNRESVALYCWCALGAAGLALWGVRDGRAERLNLGIVGLAVTVMTFYFSNIMDKLGRSASLAGLGLLFLGGGWLLERTRRRLLIHMAKEAL